jgi:hypothetical protein
MTGKGWRPQDRIIWWIDRPNCFRFRKKGTGCFFSGLFHAEFSLDLNGAVRAQDGGFEHRLPIFLRMGDIEIGFHVPSPEHEYFWAMIHTGLTARALFYVNMNLHAMQVHRTGRFGVPPGLPAV